MDSKAIQKLVPQLFSLVEELEAAAPGVNFSPAGSMIGTIGEVIAAARYGLELAKSANEGFDAIAPDGRKVEVKTSTRKYGIFLLRVLSEPIPDLHLIALKLDKKGRAETVYNGPASLAYKHCGPKQKANFYPIGEKTLRELQKSLIDQQLPETIHK